MLTALCRENQFSVDWVNEQIAAAFDSFDPAETKAVNRDDIRDATLFMLLSQVFPAGNC